jgi:hypothetical protein
MLKKIALIALCSMSAFALESIELNINNEDLEVITKFDMSNFNSDTESRTVFVGIRLLDVDQVNSDDANASLDALVECSFLMRREIENKGVYLGLGMKINTVKNMNDKFVSIPLGLELDYQIPVFYSMPMYMG